MYTGLGISCMKGLFLTLDYDFTIISVRHFMVQNELKGVEGSRVREELFFKRDERL